MHAERFLLDLKGRPMPKATEKEESTGEQIQYDGLQFYQPRRSDASVVLRAPAAVDDNGDGNNVDAKTESLNDNCDGYIET